MTEILLTVIIILLIINIVIALTKNNRLQTERLEGLLREEMKDYLPLLVFLFGLSCQP